MTAQEIAEASELSPQTFGPLERVANDLGWDSGIAVTIVRTAPWVKKVSRSRQRSKSRGMTSLASTTGSVRSKDQGSDYRSVEKDLNLPSVKMVHLSEDFDENPAWKQKPNKDDEPWFMRRLLKQVEVI